MNGPEVMYNDAIKSSSFKNISVCESSNITKYLFKKAIMKAIGKEKKEKGKDFLINAHGQKSKTLHTEPPLSEKDEFKAAEERTREAQHEADVKSELRIRTDGKQ